MFWIGLVVGMIVTVAALFGCYALALCEAGMTHKENVSFHQLGFEASRNRRSVICAYNEYETLGVVTFEEEDEEE